MQLLTGLRCNDRVNLALWSPAASLKDTNYNLWINEEN